MSTRKITAAVFATAALLGVAPAAHASVSEEIYASGVVERLATRHNHGYDFVASCDEYNRGRFWCMVSGRRGDCYLQGHATVRRTRERGGYRYSTTIQPLNSNCD